MFITIYGRGNEKIGFSVFFQIEVLRFLFIFDRLAVGVQDTYISLESCMYRNLQKIVRTLFCFVFHPP